LAEGTNNTALAMMAALGPCGNLTASTVIMVNELTTVAAVWPLAPFMSSYSSVGSGSSDATVLAAAFTLAANYANVSTGTIPGLNVPAGTTVPIAQINTLADILSICVNSPGGAAGDGSTCGMLLTAATPTGGTAPVNVIGAGLNIANNPTANISNLFALAAGAAAY
jgi:trimeric autotransporter adhesin